MLITSNTLVLPKDKTQCVHLEVTSPAIVRCSNKADGGWLCSYHIHHVLGRERKPYRAEPDRELVVAIKRVESRAIASHEQTVVHGIRQVKDKTMAYSPLPYAREVEEQDAFIKARVRIIRSATT